MKRFSLILAFALILLAPGIVKTYAQDINKDIGFAIWPTQRNTVEKDKIILEVKPGATVQESVTVKNGFDTEMSFNLYPVDMYIAKNGAMGFSSKNDKLETVGKWITPDSNTVTLQPREEKTLTFPITVPSDTALKQYEGGIAFENVRHSSDNTKINIASRIIQRIKVRVTDNPQPVPKYGETNVFNSATSYFWASLAIFLGCMAYFLRAYLKDKKKAKEQNPN